MATINLIVMEGPDDFDQVIRVDTPGLTLGRGDKSHRKNVPDSLPHIQIPGCGQVSRYHCLIQRGGDWFDVRDFSANGTYVNDEPVPSDGVRALPLRHGDQLRLGSWLFLIKMVQVDSPPPLPFQSPGGPDISHPFNRTPAPVWGNPSSDNAPPTPPPLPVFHDPAPELSSPWNTPKDPSQPPPLPAFQTPLPPSPPAPAPDRQLQALCDGFGADLAEMRALGALPDDAFRQLGVVLRQFLLSSVDILRTRREVKKALYQETTSINIPSLLQLRAMAAMPESDLDGSALLHSILAHGEKGSAEIEETLDEARRMIIALHHGTESVVLEILDQLNPDKVSPRKWFRRDWSSFEDEYKRQVERLETSDFARNFGRKVSRSLDVED